ncbi:AraC family transcriptional regulator [Polaribacter sp. SA4-10]|uniref:helix-turn-helix domain-containing protein n=1 Tax=Polaribacter sp. SA4-10 TaxID=754397 RepID=UPI001E57CB3C|nr:AraC family transcriptional regulator [Polaribacter sp. SA4-10]
MIRSYRSNPFYNFFLVLVIGLVSFRFLVHGSYDLSLQVLLKPDRGVHSILYLIIVPCYYLYYKYLTLQKKAYSYKDLKHLIFILFLYFINSNETLENSFIFYFGPITNFFLIGIFMLFYLIVAFALLSKSIWFRKNKVFNSKHFNLVKNWTMYLFTINTLSSVMVLVSLYTESNNGVSLSGKSMAIFSLLFWLFIFFKILTSPEILFGLPILNKTLIRFNDPLSEEEEEQEEEEVVIEIDDNWVFETDIPQNSQDKKLQEKVRSNIVSYINEVEKLTAEKLIFRNQKTSQSDIAVKLGVPASHIVYLFKYHSKLSFSEYRMNSRIQDAISLIKTGFLQTETFESVAYTTGFSSYNPFFIAFKKITTYSPLDYVKAKK